MVNIFVATHNCAAIELNEYLHCIKIRDTSLRTTYKCDTYIYTNSVLFIGGKLVSSCLVPIDDASVFK